MRTTCIQALPVLCCRPSPSLSPKPQEQLLSTNPLRYRHFGGEETGVQCRGEEKVQREGRAVTREAVLTGVGGGLRTQQMHSNEARGSQKQASLPEALPGEICWLSYNMWVGGLSHFSLLLRETTTPKCRNWRCLSDERTRKCGKAGSRKRKSRSLLDGVSQI